MRRVGQIIGLKPDQIEAYERLHSDVWPEVLAMISACHIRNYSIFRHGELLFAYFEYIGDDYEADMAKMAADPKSHGSLRSRAHTLFLPSSDWMQWSGLLVKFRLPEGVHVRGSLMWLKSLRS